MKHAHYLQGCTTHDLAIVQRALTHTYEQALQDLVDAARGYDVPELAALLPHEIGALVAQHAARIAAADFR